jgi:hypothetical protein
MHTFSTVRSTAGAQSCLGTADDVCDAVSSEWVILSSLLLWRTGHRLLSLCKVRWLRCFVIPLCYTAQHEARSVDSFLFRSWYNVTEFVDYVSWEPDKRHVTWKLSDVLSRGSWFQSCLKHARYPPLWLRYVGRIRVSVDRLCGLVVRVPGYTTEMYCASCEVRTEFIYVM